MLLDIADDCKHLIFSYLSLKDCLNYGSSCFKTLEQIEPILVQRRRQEFSVQICERIGILYHSLNANHPSKYDVNELFFEVRNRSSHSDGFEKTTELSTNISQSSKNSDTLHERLKTYGKILRAHRLYSSLLIAAVDASGLKHNGLPIQLVATVDRYIGDVMVFTMLVGGNIDVGRDGLSSEVGWIYYILSKVRQRPKEACSWYSIWIFLHSSLLRLQPLSEKVRKSYGIKYSNTTDDLSSFEKLDKNPFAPNSDFVYSQMKDALSILKNMSFSCAPKFYIYDFGNLGPVFRGRDHLRMLKADIGVINSFLIRLIDDRYFMDESDQVGQQESSIFDQIRNDLSWVLTVHRVVLSTRPMTVKQPKVQFDLSSL